MTRPARGEGAAGWRLAAGGGRSRRRVPRDVGLRSHRSESAGRDPSPPWRRPYARRLCGERDERRLAVRDRARRSPRDCSPISTPTTTSACLGCSRRFRWEAGRLPIVIYGPAGLHDLFESLKRRVRADSAIRSNGRGARRRRTQPRGLHVGHSGGSRDQRGRVCDRRGCAPQAVRVEAAGRSACRRAGTRKHFSGVSRSSCRTAGPSPGSAPRAARAGRTVV